MNLRDLGAFPFDITLYDTSLVYFMRPDWQPNVGIPALDLTIDIRNVQLGGGAAVSIKPAKQFAPARIDRPDDYALITNGNVLTTNDLRHYQETLASPTKMFVRDGVGAQLTSGSFARLQGTLYTSFLSLGLVLPAEEFVVQPGNAGTVKAVYPLGGGKPLIASKVSKARLVVFGSGNLTTTMSWQLCCRFFNDPRARGDWTLIDMARTPNVVNFEANTGDVAFTGITTSDFHWFELGVAVWKAQDQDPTSRCVFQVLPSLSYG